MSTKQQYETVRLKAESLSEFQQVTLIWFFAAALRYREILIADESDPDEVNQQVSQALTFLCDTWATAEYVETLLEEMPEAEAEKHRECIVGNAKRIFQQASNSVETLIAKTTTPH